jgi:hypothetical protein
MLISGIISILQITILPGLAVINLLRIKPDTAIQKWLYIFSFSLFINYCLVTILTLFSFYTVTVLWGIVIIEMLYLLFFCRDEFKNLFPGIKISESFLRLKIFITNSSPVNKILLIISGIILLFYCSVFIANIGTIFYFIDTVNNYEWNRWAIDFASNILPKYSSHFPQLIPANWSVCYVLIGKMDVHFFPKAIMPLFLISNLLIFLDLALTKKNNVFLVGMIIYGLFAPIFYSVMFIAGGNADVPVSFFAFLTFYAFVKFSPTLNNAASRLISFSEVLPTQKDNIINKYLLVFLFASMAASTKLAGFYTFSITSFILIVFLFTSRKSLNKIDLFRILLSAIVISALSLFWYFKSPTVMYSGLNQPEYLSPEGTFTIVARALKLLYFNFGLPVCAFFILTITASIFEKKTRLISLVMIIIPFSIWIIKYSADFRNLSFIVPFLSVSSAIGLYKIISLFKYSISPEKENPITPADNKSSINKKEKYILVLSSIMSGMTLLFVMSDKFYLLLYNVYQFIHKYYFQSNRIVYFIEYDLLLHVDFYQRIFIAMFLLLFVLAIMILIKMRISVIITIVLFAAVLLNFTSFKENDIVNYQKECFNKVEARNYYGWIKMIVDGPDSLKQINTNFKEILHDKIPRENNFKYVEKVSKSFLEGIKTPNYKLFLKAEYLNNETRNFIKIKIDGGDYTRLLVDSDFIFFVVNPL